MNRLFREFAEDYILEKLGDKEIISSIIEKIVIPVRHIDKSIPYIGTVFFTLGVWKTYKNLLLSAIEQTFESVGIGGIPLYEIVFYYLTIVFMIIARIIVGIAASYWKKGSEVLSGKLNPYLEYSTMHQKVFLKKEFLFVRNFFSFLSKLMISTEIVRLVFEVNEKFSTEYLLFIYIICLIRDIFRLYTCEEYEEILKKIPENTRKKKIERFKNKLNDYSYKDAVLKETVFCNRLPDLQVKEKCNNEIEKFLYRNSGSLEHKELLQRIMADESVLTDTPFYKDMGIAFFLPLHQALLKGKKIIVFSGGSETREEMEKWLRDGVRAVTKMEECWKIVSLSQEVKVWDIGLITMDDLSMLYENSNLLNSKEGCVIVFIHPERLLLEAQSELYEWGYLMSLEKIKPVYVVIERAILGLLDLVSHIFRTEFKYVSQSPMPSCISNVYIMKERRMYAYFQNMNMTAYLGTSAVMAALANNLDIKDINWMAGDKKAFYDINSIMKQHQVLLLSILNNKTETIVSGEIECKAGLWGLPKEKAGFFIVEDEINNIWEMIRQVQTRAKESGIISVIADEYMLLPFMVDKLDVFMNDLYAISAMTASFTQSVYNRNIILAKMLLYRGLSAREIREFRSRYYEQEDTPFENILKKEEEIEVCEEFKQIFGYDVSLNRNYYENNQRIYKYYLSKNTELEKEIKSITAPAVYLDEEENVKTFLGGKHFWQIDQNYLPGQIVVLDGKMYSVGRRKKVYIDSEMEEVLIVRRYREGIIYIPKYSQDREYLFCFNETKAVTYENEKYGIEWELLQLPVTVKTYGYYNLRNIEKKENNGQISEEQLDEYIHLEKVDDRNYEYVPESRKNVIALKFGLDVEWKVRCAFAIIFSEILKTLFPEGHQYIAVLAVNDSANRNHGSNKDSDKKSVSMDMEKIKHLYYKTDANEEKINADILIVEDSKMDVGILAMINLHMGHILRIIYTYYKWYQEQKDKEQLYNPEIVNAIMEIMQNCEEYEIETLHKYRKVAGQNNINVNQSSEEKTHRCQHCFDKIVKGSKLCPICENSCLTQEVYEEIFRTVCWQLSIMFGFEIDIAVNIVVVEKQEELIKRKGNCFYCDCRAKPQAAMAEMIYELMIYWMQITYSWKQKTAGVPYWRSGRKAIAEWYVLHIMSKYSFKDYVENRKASIESEQKYCIKDEIVLWRYLERKGKKKFLKKLEEVYTLGNEKGEHPLK